MLKKATYIISRFRYQYIYLCQNKYSYIMLNDTMTRSTKLEKAFKWHGRRKLTMDSEERCKLGRVGSGPAWPSMTWAVLGLSPVL